MPAIRYQQIDDYTAHILTDFVAHHGSQPTRDTIHRCHRCGLNMRDLNRLHTHMKVSHPRAGLQAYNQW